MKSPFSCPNERSRFPLTEYKIPPPPKIPEKLLKKCNLAHPGPVLKITEKLLRREGGDSVFCKGKPGSLVRIRSESGQHRDRARILESVKCRFSKCRFSVLSFFVQVYFRWWVERRKINPESLGSVFSPCCRAGIDAALAKADFFFAGAPTIENKIEQKNQNTKVASAKVAFDTVRESGQKGEALRRGQGGRGRSG